MHTIIISIITTITIYIHYYKIVNFPKVPKKRTKVSFILLGALQLWAVVQEHSKSCFRAPTTGSKAPKPREAKRWHSKK